MTDTQKRNGTTTNDINQKDVDIMEEKPKGKGTKGKGKKGKGKGKKGEGKG